MSAVADEADRIRRLYDTHGCPGGTLFTRDENVRALLARIAELEALERLANVETAPTHYHTANVLAGVLERLRDAVALPSDAGAFVLRSVVEGEIEEIETLRAAHAATLPGVSP